MPRGRTRKRDSGSSLPKGFKGQCFFVVKDHCASMFHVFPAALQGAAAGQDPNQVNAGMMGGMPMQMAAMGHMQNAFAQYGYAGLPPGAGPMPSAAMPMASPYGTMGQMQAETSHTKASTHSTRERSRSRSGSPPSSRIKSGARSDDKDKISSSYRFFGGVHAHGPRATIPRKLRQSCLTRIDDDNFNVIMLSGLDDESIDLLLYIVCGLLPNGKVADLQVNTKGEL